MSRNTNEKSDSHYYSTEKKSIVIGNYTLEKSIGEGTFGKVHLGFHILTKEKVAVKILEKSKIKDEDSIERVNREITFLKKLKNENIIKLYEIIESSKSIFLIMEYAPHGELFNYIVKKQRLDEKEASFFFVQIINGIEFIHSHSIAHRDLKPENLLLSENNTLKIIDFGLSNSYKNNPLLKTPCGSPCYAAPEMLLGKQYNGLQIDIWSTGIILYAMVNGFLPFEDENNAVLYKKILECNLYFPYQLSDRCLDMIKRLLTTNPDKRITLDEIKEHSFYKIGYKYLKKKEINFDNNMLTKHTLEKMVNMNFSKSTIFKNLNENHHNNITATFHLIFNNLKCEYYFKNSTNYINKDNYNSHSHLMKEDRICIFNEVKKKKSNDMNHKHEVCETEINLKDNVPKMVLFEKENIQQNSNRAESMTNERVQTFSTTGNSKKATAGSIKTHSSKNPNNFNKKSCENKKEDIYLKTEVNNNNLNVNDDNAIEPFYTVMNTTDENDEIKKIKKNTQKTLSLNLHSNNNISNLVKTKKLNDNYLSLGIKNDIQGLLKKQKDKIQIEKLFNVKKEEKSVNISSPNNLKKDNKAALELQQQIFNKFSNYEVVQTNTQNKAYSKIKISQNFQNILKDFKTKMAVNNVKSPKNPKPLTNFSLDKRKKTSEQNTKILKQNTSIIEKNKIEKPITFSPISNNHKNKAAHTLKENNYFIRTSHISSKQLDNKNESISKERDISKKNSSQYCTSILVTESNVKNYRKTESNINNSGTTYTNLLTENCFSAKSKMKKNKQLCTDNKGKTDEVFKNFSPKNILLTSKQSENSKKSIFDYKLKPTTIKLSKPSGSSESPTKKKESSISQDLNCFKIDKLEEIKSKIFKFCKTNNMKINEIERNKFECNKNNNTFGIEIVNQTSNSSKLLKVTHLNGKEDITKDVIKRFLSNIEIEA